MPLFTVTMRAAGLPMKSRAFPVRSTPPASLQATLRTIFSTLSITRSKPLQGGPAIPGAAKGAHRPDAQH